MLRFVDNRVQKAAIPFKVLEVGQFFMKDGLMYQKIETSTGQNNSVQYSPSGVNMARCYRDDHTFPVDVTISIDKDAVIIDQEELDTPPPQDVGEEVGGVVVPFNTMGS